jgi:cell wall-associated NlpC family hydrolase
MAGPATALLAAYNGKPSQTPGNNYGGYNPFSPVATPGDPGLQAQNDVTNSQANYQSQQDSARSQLQTNLQPSSIGGNLSDPNSTYSSNNVQSGQSQNDPFAQFNSLISQVNQNGKTATDAANLAELNSWQNKLSGLANTYKQNISQPASWDQSTVDSILGKLGVTPNSGGALSYSGSAFNGGLNGSGIKLPAGTDPNSLGARAIAIARQSLGVPYVWGGNSLTQGVDCSGLVQQVYERLGIQLPRTSTEQAKAGKVVPSLSQALPGDLILMYSPYEPAGLQQYGHVGLYIGNGMMLDAPHTGAVVRIEQISNMTGIVRPW